VRVKCWEIIADNLRKAGWSLGWVLAVDSNGRTIFVADAHRGDEKRFLGKERGRKCASARAPVIEGPIPPPEGSPSPGVNRNASDKRSHISDLSLSRLDQPWVRGSDSNGRTIWIADAHRDDVKRYVVHADEKLTAFLDLERIASRRRDRFKG
jgi:hypothetical protein